MTKDEKDKLRVQVVKQLEYIALIQKACCYPEDSYSLLLLAAKIIKYDNQELVYD